MGFVEKLVFWIIPLIVLIVLGMTFFGGGNLYDNAKSLVKGVYNSFSFGIQEEQAGPLVVPKEYQGPIEKMVRMIKFMSGKGSCFQSYSNGNLIDLSEGQISLVLEQGARNEIVLNVVKGTEGKGPEITSYPLGKMKLCVIEGDAAKNFYENFIVPKGLSNRESHGYKSFNSNYFREVSQIVILPGNKIQFDSKTWNLEDGGGLFTPDGQHICFIPTAKGKFSCQLRGNLIDNDCFDEGNYFVSQGSLKSC